MIYNNLLYFLVVIFALASDTAPAKARMDFWAAIPVTLALYLLFSLVSARVFRRKEKGSAEYFSAERTLSILAVVLFIFLLHIVDLKYYLHPLSFDGHLPVLENIGGFFFFYLFLVLMWLQARPAYQRIFHRSYAALSFISSNTRANLPIILPWVVLSLVFDILAWLDLPGTKWLLESSFGDGILFLAFVFFLVLLFPPLVRWLWNCKPMPQSPLRMEIESFSHRQKFSSEILLWPLFEGQVITAGIMGIIPPLRYLLLTPALLHTMNRDELEAVLAHEIGHVKKMHLILYILLFLSFSVFVSAAAEPLNFLFLGSDWFYSLSGTLNVSPENVLVALFSLSFLLLMILYFRFLFGFFIRNFERQADLYVFKALGNSRALVSSFEKIAILGGNIREQKSWHHFGIGERITFLDRCEQDRSLVRKQDRKVYSTLVVYFLVIALSAFLLGRVDTERLAAASTTKFMEAVIQNKLQPDPKYWLFFLEFGDFMQKKKMERKAMEAYEEALRLAPGHPDIYNNLAWLLVTTRDRSLLDPPRAVTLAEKALAITEKGYILDTLAVALWATGRRDEAIATERRAMAIDPENSPYYRQQAEKIAKQDWEPPS